MKFYYKALFLGTILLMTHDTASAMFSRCAKELGEIGARSVRLRSVVSATPVIDLTTRGIHSTRILRMPYGAIIESRELSDKLEAEKKVVGPVTPTDSNRDEEFLSATRKTLYKEISETAKNSNPSAVQNSTPEAFFGAILAGC